MYICRSCGNYYQFNGSAFATVSNKLNPIKGGYEEESDIEYNGLDFVTCMECDSENTIDIDIKALPKELQDDICSTLGVCSISVDTMRKLKEFINK